MVCKELSLAIFWKKSVTAQAFPHLTRLSFHIARKFKLHPSANTDDYSHEFDDSCEQLGLDSEEMQLLVANKIEKVKYPPGDAFSRAVTNAMTKPKKFSVVFKKKSFAIVNIIFYLSQEYPKGGHFPIPVKLNCNKRHTDTRVCLRI